MGLRQGAADGGGVPGPFPSLTETLLFNPGISALCYRQLTDVEQEINGLLTYDRRAKFDPQVIASILKQKAAVEG